VDLHQHLKEQQKQDLDLLKQYEEKLRYEEDPRQKQKWKANICEIKQRISEYEAELNSLNEQSSNQEKSGNIADLKKYVSTWDWLTKTLESANLELVREAYLECRNPDFLQGKDNPVPNNILDIVTNLANMPRKSDLYPPIWLFVTYLSREPSISKTIREELRAQIQKQLDETTRKTLKEWVDRLKKPKHSAIDPYLMLQIRQNHSRDSRFFVTAWLLSDDICDSSREFVNIEGIPNFYFDSQFKRIALQEKELEFPNSPLLQKQQEGWPWQYIQNFIGSIINFSTGILNQHSSQFQLTVEFFLPKELLNEPVDSWEPDNEYGFGNSLPIGYDYKVVVRSNERLSSRYRARNLWWDKWQQVTQDETKPASGYFFSTTECPDDSKNLFYQLNQKHFIGCSLQAALFATNQDNFFWCIYRAGIPIALWLRRHLCGLNYQDEIQNLLDSTTIAELPEAVWQQRRLAREQQASFEEHIGYHLSLWWDNPYRLPPKENLKI
jgi:hypothetical protein